MTPAEGAKPIGDRTHSPLDRDADQGTRLSPRPVLSASRSPASGVENGPYGAYGMLLLLQRRKYRERGELDPATWIAIGEQAHDDPRLSAGQKIVLRQAVEDALRGGATLLGWG